jgi:ATP-dependent DNA helicase RecQ
MEVIQRHKNEAGIIYCLSRREVDNLTAELQDLQVKAMPYHAGHTSEQRRLTQDAFAAEQCDIVVATVAFGMGIDRSNVRFVMHTTMPKSVEHYQQETGRAGRDGLEAECVMLHSGGDIMKWKRILEMSTAEPGIDPAVLANSMQHLRDLDQYCRGSVCRHRALVKYFGQEYPADNCTACDLCLGDAEPVPDAAVVAQKILSCVARVKERFGIVHVVSVLRGENTESVRRWNHNELTTYGLLREYSKSEVRDWIHQLIGQNVLCHAEMPLSSGNAVMVLRLNPASWEVMHKTRAVKLMQPARRAIEERPSKSKADTVSWEGVDRELFEELRKLRRSLAEERGVQPYMIFSDASLREFALCRPTNLEGLRLLYGVGDKKLSEFGETFLRVITDYCTAHKQTTDMARPAPARPATPAKPTRIPLEALEMFRQQAVVEDVMHVTGRARSTVMDYLYEYIRSEKPASICTWVPDVIYREVAVAAKKVGTERLKPIFVELGEKISYDEIRLVVAHLEAVAERAKKPTPSGTLNTEATVRGSARHER